MCKKSLAGATLGASTLLWASPASAQDSEVTDALQAVMDNLWLVIAGCLVFLMQAGFAFVEAGLTRAKNLANIMAKNLADMAIGVTMFFAVGYSIAFDGPGDGHWWGGLGNFMMLDDVDVLNTFGASGVGNLTPAVITEAFATCTGGPVAIGFPGLAELAAGAAVGRTASLVVHGGYLLAVGRAGKMARPERFELPTFWFVARHSIQMSYSPYWRL